MEKITSASGLRNAIQLLEIRQATELLLLKEQIKLTSEKLTPLNLMKSTFKEAVSSPSLTHNLVNAAIGLGTGFVANKLFFGGTLNPLTKLLGVVVESVVATQTAKNADGIKSAGSSILRRIFNRQTKTEKV